MKHASNTKLLKSIRLNNLLSFGPDTEELPLENLNVLIGPNGAGKSNLIEAISLLKAAPRELAIPIREGGGIGDWLWKGAKKTTIATLNILVHFPGLENCIRHTVSFTEKARRFAVVVERVKDEFPTIKIHEYVYFTSENGDSLIHYNSPSLDERKESELYAKIDVNPEQSILSQIKAADIYPEITYIGEEYSKIKLFREWSFGRNTPSRMPQKADMPNDFLEEDCSNLGLVLSAFRGMPEVKVKFLEALRVLYEEATDFDVRIEGGTVQVFLQEGNMIIPATRLSDGTLRYLCLLAILLHPKPPKLVCIEEPELGLHTDALPTLAKLIKEASERTQLIITTHSPDLIDELTDMPQTVVVCEKHNGSTEMKRLDAEDLKVWLKKYRLGQYWRSGGVGGNRW